MSLFRQGKNNANYGNRLSEEAKRKISIANTGRKVSEETIELGSNEIPNNAREVDTDEGKFFYSMERVEYLGEMGAL